MIKETLRTLLRNEIAAMGCELWTCHLTYGNDDPLLQVFIDKPGGVNLQDCETVMRHLRVVLAVEAANKTAYRLEVSSPGLDRELSELRHYEQFLGATIKLKLRFPIEGKRNFAGILLAATLTEGVSLQEQTTETVLRFNFDQIEKARLVPDLSIK